MYATPLSLVWTSQIQQHICSVCATLSITTPQPHNYLYARPSSQRSGRSRELHLRASQSYKLHKRHKAERPPILPNPVIQDAERRAESHPEDNPRALSTLSTLPSCERLERKESEQSQASPKQIRTQSPNTTHNPPSPSRAPPRAPREERLVRRPS